MKKAHLAATRTGADSFGNVMQDSPPLEMIPPSGDPRLGAPVKPHAQAPGYRTLLDLPAPPTGHVRVGRLTMYRDFSQNSFKVARYRILRTRMCANLSAAAPPGIFLCRGRDGQSRRLVNEGAMAIFRRHGASTSSTPTGRRRAPASPSRSRAATRPMPSIPRPMTAALSPPARTKAVFPPIPTRSA